MGYYSDPTANMALGNINRQFSHWEKKAKRIRRLWVEGKLTYEDLERIERQFTGIYRNVLLNALRQEEPKEKATSPSAE